MPVIGEPFKRIAMDIVGPLPKTKQRHQYTTRYPETYPLRTVTAPAEKLDMFARYGILEEILTDQRTNFTSHFTSQLLSRLYELLKVKAILTSPQTDELIKRFNQTLKAMLK